MEDNEKLNELLLGLDKSEGFKVWRDEIAKPILDQIEQKKSEAMTMNEYELRATIMYENLVKSLFYRIFDNIREVKRLDQKKENDGRTKRSS